MISTLCTLLDNSASTAAWAGADFEHNVVGLEFKQVGHHCNRQRLRDRLIEAYRERPIQVGIMLNLDRHKLVPRDFGQCAKDAPVQRCPANLGGTAVGNYFERRNHLSSLLLEKFHAHRDLAVASLPPSAQRHHRKTQLTA
jgi:hypothetical protein